jgi:hypothetical protein
MSSGAVSFDLTRAMISLRFSFVNTSANKLFRSSFVPTPYILSYGPSNQKHKMQSIL